MNRYEQYIAEFLSEFKEVSLEKIGVIKTAGGYTDDEAQSIPVDFTFDRKAITTPQLADFIAAKTGKSKMLITSDLESHFTQAREFINIGKTYEIINAGFIKKNNSGVYELLPLSQAVKAQKNFSRPAAKNKHRKKRGASLVQLFTLLIVLAIISALGWEAYQFFVKPAVQKTTKTQAVNNAAAVKDNDTAASKDSLLPNTITATADTSHTTVYNDNDTVLVHYIFETTNLLLRARSRTDKLISFGNNAGYDSVVKSGSKLYSLYIFKKTKIADTLAVKDSLAKFLQKDIQIKMVPNP